jgi:hypothetical protein
MTDNKIAIIVEQLKKLENDYKTGRAALLGKAKKAEIDPGALQRLAVWSPQKELLRREREALDDQLRFLAGLRPTPAKLPAGGKLATAAALYAQGLSVRKVAKKMSISTGSAQLLKVKAAAFTVPPQVSRNTAPTEPPEPIATVSEKSDIIQQTDEANIAPDEPRQPTATGSAEADSEKQVVEAILFNVQSPVNMNTAAEEPPLPIESCSS